MTFSWWRHVLFCSTCSTYSVNIVGGVVQVSRPQPSPKMLKKLQKQTSSTPKKEEEMKMKAPISAEVTTPTLKLTQDNNTQAKDVTKTSETTHKPLRKNDSIASTVIVCFLYCFYAFLALNFFIFCRFPISRFYDQRPVIEDGDCLEVIPFF